MARISLDELLSLESLTDALARGDVVSYGDIGESDGRRFLTIWDADNSEEQICPDVLYRLIDWIESLPKTPPNEDP